MPGEPEAEVGPEVVGARDGDGVLTVTLNRPARLNAFTLTGYHQFTHLLEAVGA